MLQNKEIRFWINKIGNSKLSVNEFFEKYNVPFGKTQYYAYLKMLKIDDSAVLSARTKNRKLSSEAENFIIAYLSLSDEINLSQLQNLIAKRFECKMSISGLSKAIARISPDGIARKVGRPRKAKNSEEYNQLGGFEMIVAIAYYLGWPDMVAKLIFDRVKNFKRTNQYKESEKNIDKKCKDKSGRFTKRYNQRRDVRTNKFGSVEDKRKNKNWRSMNIIHDSMKALIRKNMALLSLPIVTLNGSVRNVNTAMGQSLGNFCGYDYKQSSLNKYLSELKYLGISTDLLKALPLIWTELWKDDSTSIHESLVCFYIDGNTKGLWSSKRVKQNKVTMLGRVMGCLEQVFVHDCFGHPIYFETYSGQAPTGEYVLELFDKIEEVITDVPRSQPNIYRAIVMDGANNSAKTLRSFASQNKYHYITPLDDNQFKERMIVRKIKSGRYSEGEASLYELEIELHDSVDKGKIIRTRAIEIQWDNGRKTVLMTNLPADIIDSSSVVWSYFRRWPCQETQFKKDKSAVSLSKIAGYGKKEIDNERVQNIRNKLKDEIGALKRELRNPLDQIDCLGNSIARLIRKERAIKAKSKVKDGEVILSKKLMLELKAIVSNISRVTKNIKLIEKEHAQKLKKFRKKQQEWIRLEKKEKVYAVDVELDQIMTFFRISLSGFLTYFVKNILHMPTMDINQLIYKIIHLHAKIETENGVRIISFTKNEKDEETMSILQEAISKLNGYGVVGPHGKVLEFRLC